MAHIVPLSHLKDKLPVKFCSSLRSQWNPMPMVTLCRVNEQDEDVGLSSNVSTTFPCHNIFDVARAHVSDADDAQTYFFLFHEKSPFYCAETFIPSRILRTAATAASKASSLFS
jgi:hypothetical protein